MLERFVWLNRLFINIMIRVILLSILVFIIHSSLPYQAHSFNDLDLVEKMIVDKEVKYFKLDLSYATRDSCVKHSTWNSSSPCFLPKESTEEICCLAFRGDASSRPYFKYPFNTSQQFVNMIRSVMQKDLKLGVGKPLLFAINFQYSHSFDDFLSEEFLVALTNLENQFSDRLLLGTGSDSFLLEYDRVCHLSLPICTDSRKKISESKMFLQSSSYSPHDNRDYNKRYRNFNTFYQSMEKFCREGFPLWINNYPQYPLIAWQPSNERQIQWTLSQLLHPDCMRKHGRTIEGIAIASNLDLEMFTMYSKPTISQVPQEWMPNQNKLFIPGDHIRIVAPSPNTILAVNQVDKKLTATFYTYEQGKLTKKSESDIEVLTEEEQMRYLASSNQYYIVVTEKDKLSKVYYWNYDNHLVREESVGAKVEGVAFKGEELIYLKGIGNNHTICGTRDWMQIKHYASLETYGNFSSLTLAADGFLLAGYMEDGQGSIFIVKVDSDSKITSNTLTFGSNPQLAVLGEKVTVVFENSMCSGGLLLNNNDMPACNPTVYPEFQSMARVSNLVSMIEASVGTLLQKEGISPCSRDVNYSKVFVGGDIGVSLVGEQLFLTGKYIPVEQQDLVLSLFCGAANFDRSLLGQNASILMSSGKFWTTPTPQLRIQ